MLEWMAELNPEDRERVIREAFNQVAASDQGKIVFATIFEHLYLFREAKTPEAQVLCNYAKYLLTYFGEDAPYRAISALIGG